MANHIDSRGMLKRDILDRISELTQIAEQGLLAQAKIAVINMEVLVEKGRYNTREYGRIKMNFQESIKNHSHPNRSVELEKRYNDACESFKELKPNKGEGR